jgi:hypothetical protein
MKKLRVRVLTCRDLDKIEDAGAVNIQNVKLRVRVLTCRDLGLLLFHQCGKYLNVKATSECVDMS